MPQDHRFVRGPPRPQREAVAPLEPLASLEPLSRNPERGGARGARGAPCPLRALTARRLRKVDKPLLGAATRSSTGATPSSGQMPRSGTTPRARRRATSPRGSSRRSLPTTARRFRSQTAGASSPPSPPSPPPASCPHTLARRSLGAISLLGSAAAGARGNQAPSRRGMGERQGGRGTLKAAEHQKLTEL